MEDSIQLAAILLGPPVILLLGLAFTVIRDPYIRRDHKRVMLVIIALVLCLMAQNCLEYVLSYVCTQRTLRTISSIIGYIVRPTIMILFFYFVSDGRRCWPAWILNGVNAVIYLTALFSPLAFTISDSNNFLRGPLGFSCHILTGLLLINLLIVTLRQYGATDRAAGIPVFSTLLIVISVALDTTLLSSLRAPVTALTLSVVICCVFYYIWLHLQFVRMHEQALYAEQRIRIMVSQIQPHFLYNTIATVRALCKRDPDKAADVAEKFGQYLRQNLDTLDTTGLIPFSRELEHTQLYAEIEMVRFENLRMEYDIEDRAFSLPPLTVQPMVENAIRHGIRVRREGVVRVRTRRKDGFHEIIIEDNGIGFDVKKVENVDGGHIGIRNVRERIEKMCGGTLTLESREGVGSTVTIRIPQKEAEA